MAYGIQITNNANQVIMDTSLESAIQVIDEDTLTANSTLDRNTGDLYYFNRPSTGRLKIHYDVSNDRYRNDTGITVSYVRCRIVKDAVVPTSSGYGLETYADYVDSQNNPVCTYSMGYNKGYKLLELYPCNALYGTYPSSSVIMYSGNPTGIYVYTGKGLNIDATNFYDMSYWDYTNNYIQFSSQLDLSDIGGGILSLSNGSACAVINPRN